MHNNNSSSVTDAGAMILQKRLLWHPFPPIFSIDYHAIVGCRLARFKLSFPSGMNVTTFQCCRISAASCIFTRKILGIFNLKYSDFSFDIMQKVSQFFVQNCSGVLQPSHSHGASVRSVTPNRH